MLSQNNGSANQRMSSKRQAVDTMPVAITMAKYDGLSVAIP
jgi:hypothetical protein